MASFCVAVILGINSPLLLVLEVTSKAAEAAGVLVPMPTWAYSLEHNINRVIGTKRLILIFIEFNFLDNALLRGLIYM